jgi:hypothetical protein
MPEVLRNIYIFVVVEVPKRHHVSGCRHDDQSLTFIINTLRFSSQANFKEQKCRSFHKGKRNLFAASRTERTIRKSVYNVAISSLYFSF